MRTILLICVLTVLSGCAVRGGGSIVVHDPIRNDDHKWNKSEADFYVKWETETHRSHMEIKDRPDGEQREYFTWRHAH